MFGLQVFNASGGKTLDVSDRVGLLLGTFVIPKCTPANYNAGLCTGSLYIPELDGTRGTPFTFIAKTEGYWQDGGSRRYPTIDAINGTIAWTNLTGYDFTVAYGVF
ncbi:MAG: hypothetical protein LBC18_03325 [Opitutaceae bacterium]|jgi:hypothetical protein|nr:hypothetical protein [Opitutaceae bacterium]